MRIFLKLVLLAVATFFFVNKNVAQVILDGNQQNSLEQNIENISENADNQDIDYTTLLEQYSFYKKHPINLNSRDIENLRELSFVNDVQLKSLLTHIKKNGALLNIYELQSIDNWDIISIQKIMPFVYVDNLENSISNLSFAQILKDGESTIDVRTSRVIESQAGFANVSDSVRNASPNKYYVGDAFKHFVRYKFNSNNRILWGITGEKDPGEQFFRGTQKKGFDYYSAYFFVKNIGKIKALALGDYRVEFGQGLTFWTDLAFSKSVDLLVYKKNAKGLRAYNSLNENQYLRGAAATIDVIKNVNATVFFSHKKRDASLYSVDTLETANDEGFSTFLLAGLHRTPSELSKKYTVTENVYGSNVQFKKNTFNVGLTAVGMDFSVAQTKPDALYRSYDLVGVKNYNVGIDYNFVVKNINFFGEGAQSQSGGRAFISGALASLDPKLNFLALYRNYERNYQAVYVRAIGETVGAQNEKGFLMGLQYKPLYNVTMSAYFDRFTFPWLRYKINAPNTSGSDFTAFLDYAITKKIDVNFRYRKRIKPLNYTAITDGITTVGNTNQDYFRFNAVFAITSEFRLKTRVDVNTFTTVDGKKSNGYLFFQDIVFKKQRFPLTVTLRYALFDVNSYQARMYALETDLPYAYTFLSYNGRGNRFYIMLNYDINKRSEIWVRYGQTFYMNQASLNVGTPNESAGPVRSEIKLQYRYKF